ncbi:type I-E CRISPR-associated protein Cse1/CasA [Kitasatospora sp. NPDC056076]|uniref:type I-E CRISPR-associated protein Cse1/CasA n=1 Tax=Kitasatospora sp. NPDC056076 TaxID=3345703 RepID=UPI0035E32D1A
MSANLATDPWLRTIDTEGRRQVLSLADAFEHAHRVGALGDPHPLQRGATLRLMLAIAYTALGSPAGHGAYVQQHAAGLDGPKVAEWLRLNADRFDLHHPSHPFAQNAAMRGVVDEPGVVKPATILLPHAAGEGPTLFDHRHSHSGVALTWQEAAVALLARQMYSVGGIQPFTAKPFGAVARTGKLAVCTRRPLCYAEGRTLAETIALNLVPVPNLGAFNYSWTSREKRTIGAQRTPDGTVDALTFLCRSMILLPDEDGLIRRAMMCEGERYGAGGGDDAATKEPTDPALVPHTLLDDSDIPLNVSTKRPVWRMVLSAAATPERKGLLGALEDLPEAQRGHVRLTVIGQATQKSRIDGHVVGTVPLPVKAFYGEQATAVDKAILDQRSTIYKGALAVGAAVHASTNSAGDVAKRVSETTGVAFTRVLARDVPQLFTGTLTIDAFCKNLADEGDAALEVGAAPWEPAARYQAGASAAAAVTGTRDRAEKRRQREATKAEKATPAPESEEAA